MANAISSPCLTVLGNESNVRFTIAGRSVFELVTALGERAKSEGKETDAGYVVGLTNAAGVLAKMPDAPLLVPGLGAQGGDLADLAAAGRTAPDVINVSRGISYAKDDRSFSERASDWAAKISQAYDEAATI